MEDEIKTLRSYITHALNTLPPPRSSSNAYHHHHQQAAAAQQIHQTNSFNERDFGRPGTLPRHNRQNLNLNYGIINQDETFPTENDLVRPMNQEFKDIRKAEKLKYTQNTNGKLSSYVSLSPSSTDQQFVNNTSAVNSRASSFSTDQNEYGTPAEHEDGHIVQMEKDTLELRRELQDALASKKHAENKIQA